MAHLDKNFTFWLIVILRKLDIYKIIIVLAVRKRTIKHGAHRSGVRSRVEGKYASGNASFISAVYEFIAKIHDCTKVKFLSRCVIDGARSIPARIIMVVEFE